MGDALEKLRQEEPGLGGKGSCCHSENQGSSQEMLNLRPTWNGQGGNPKERSYLDEPWMAKVGWMPLPQTHTYTPLQAKDSRLFHL